MDERKHTKETNKQINEIVEMWKKEIEEMEKRIPPPDGRHFDGPRTRARIALEKKYMSMIYAVKEAHRKNISNGK